MIYIELDKLFTEEFTVLDDNNTPITGLNISDFEVVLYNPDREEVAGLSAGIEAEILEIGNGIYRISFIPNELGNWSLYIYHMVYFPYGKGENYKCVENLGGISPETEELIKRILGLSQENYRIFSTVYDTNNNMLSAIIKIYNSAEDCSADNNALAMYRVTATYKFPNVMESYKVIKL